MKKIFNSFYLLFVGSIWIHAQSLPALSSAEMYADFDTLYATISRVNTHDFVRKNLNGYGMLDSIRAVRDEIAQVKTTADFFWLINKALTYCQDAHTAVLNKGAYAAIDSLDAARLQTTIADTALIGRYNHLKRQRLSAIKLHLPIRYIKGKYLVLNDFRFNDQNIKKGAELVLFNQERPENFIQHHLGYVENLHWDFEKQWFFKDHFYKANHFDLTTPLNFVFLQENATIQIALSLENEIEIRKNIQHGTPDQPLITFFQEKGILYLRMPVMRDGELYVRKLDSVIHKINLDAIKKIVWDIRGNLGGSDDVWWRVLERLVDQPIVRNITLGANPANPYLYRFETKGFEDVENAFIPRGNYQRLINEPDTLFPNEASWHYQGKIFILQDENCFSAAGSLLSMCQFSTQLVNVGNSTGKFAGFGVMPWVYVLPHSKILYWTEPIQDLTNLEKPADIFHNKVKKPVQRSFEDFLNEYRWKGKIDLKTYLFKYDAVFKVAVQD